MSISIGRVPVYQSTDVPLRIYTGSSNLVSLRSDLPDANIYLNNGFRIGQTQKQGESIFHTLIGNVEMIRYSSNALIYTSNVQFLSNVQVTQNVIVQSNLYTRGVISCNISIYANQSIALNILNSTNPLFQIAKSGIGYVRGNLGIGTTGNYDIDVAQNAFIQSNLIVGNLSQRTSITTSNLRSLSNLANFINLDVNKIYIDAPQVILNNPSLQGSISIAGDISLKDTIVDNLSTKNIRITNNSSTTQALFIKNLNSIGFANTATGSPLHIDSYLGKTVPIFLVDTYGRVASGRLITKDTLPEYGWNFALTSNNAPYISDIIQYRTQQNADQMTLSQSGYIGIGDRPTRHPLQINNNYTTYEPIKSLIGIYQNDDINIPILTAVDCNYTLRFKITSNTILFNSLNKNYNSNYSLELKDSAYICSLNTKNIFTEKSSIDGSMQYFSNIQSLNVNYLSINGGSLSNIYINGLTVPTINIPAFEYIYKPATNYREFRIDTPRLLFYGSNFVMNWNHNFFEVEQVQLPDDNLRIYANGGPMDSVNVIQTIANNGISTLNIYNCNTVSPTTARIQVSANNKQFSLGTIYKSSGTEAFVTNDTNLTNTYRQLSVTNTGIRVGISIHALKTPAGIVTIGETTAGVGTQPRLNVKGDMIVKNNVRPYFHISTGGNIGIGTDNARRNVEFAVPIVYIDGNIGIGSNVSMYPLDVNGTIRATRVLGTQYADIEGVTANTTQWLRFGSNIYYIEGNVGIGSTQPTALLSIAAPITKDLLIQITNSNQNKIISGLEYRKNQNFIYGQHTGNWQEQTKLSILGGMAIGYSNMSNLSFVPSDTLIVDGSIGIGTTVPSKRLHIQGDITVKGHTSNEGRLYIGSNLNGNIGGGIYFGGTYGDDSFDHTVIENRIYSIGTEKSEMLLFKGNESSNVDGPDRIRLRAAQIDLDVYPSSTLNRTTENIIASVKPKRLEVYGTTNVISNSASTLQRLNGVSILKNIEYRTPGIYTILQPPNYTYVRIQMWGAGGGGGGANIQETANSSAGTDLGGGGGGGGGAYGDIIIPYDIATNSILSTTIGAGGAGGSSGNISTSTQITTTTTSSGATSGTTGGSTSLTLTTTGASAFTATWTVGGGGGGGTTATSSAGVAGTAGIISVTTYFNSTKPGTAGGAGGTTGVGGDGVNLTGGAVTGTGTGLGASGGGGGAGSFASLPSTAIYYSGGNSGSGCIPYSYLTGNAIFAYGDKRSTYGTVIQNGQNGYSYTNTYGGGTGAGGGFSRIAYSDALGTTKLVDSTATGAQQGYSVALSSDGNTLAVGGPGDNNSTGATWIFTRTAGSWDTGTKLVYSGANLAEQGRSVALSSDGNTLAVGGPGDNSDTGATWIYTRTSGSWDTGTKLFDSTATSSRQGSSVALSSDGNTLAVGGPNYASGIGVTWIYTRNSGVWTQQAKLVDLIGAIGTAGQGTSVTLSSDGNTLAVGGPLDASGIGATWIYTRNSGVWTQQGNKLVGTGYYSSSQQGWSVALSGDGNILAVGGPGDNNQTGATWIFTRSAGNWTQQGNKLIGSDAIGAAQGISVALTDDGNTLAVGGYSDNFGVGATWIFTRFETTWAQRGNKLIGYSTGMQFQGSSVALSDNGNTLAVGGYGYFSNSIGATWIFQFALENSGSGYNGGWPGGGGGGGGAARTIHTNTTDYATGYSGGAGGNGADGGMIVTFY